MLPPLLDVATCYVDEAWDSVSRSYGLGGAFTGHSSVSQLPSLSGSRKSVSVLMAEALAVRLAVMTAAFSNIKSLVILSDSVAHIKL